MARDRQGSQAWSAERYFDLRVKEVHEYYLKTIPPTLRPDFATQRDKAYPTFSNHVASLKMRIMANIHRSERFTRPMIDNWKVDSMRLIRMTLFFMSGGPRLKDEPESYH